VGGDEAAPAARLGYGTYGSYETFRTDKQHRMSECWGRGYVGRCCLRRRRSAQVRPRLRRPMLFATPPPFGHPPLRGGEPYSATTRPQSSANQGALCLK